MLDDFIASIKLIDPKVHYEGTVLENFEAIDRLAYRLGILQLEEEADEAIKI